MTELQETPQELDRKDLKILSYRQKVGEYEEQIADLRVELTITNSQLQDALARLAEREEADNAKKKAED